MAKCILCKKLEETNYCKKVKTTVNFLNDERNCIDFEYAELEKQPIDTPRVTNMYNMNELLGKNGKYANCKDQVIVIEQNGKTIILAKKELDELEKVMKITFCG